MQLHSDNKYFPQIVSKWKNSNLASKNAANYLKVCANVHVCILAVVR